MTTSAPGGFPRFAPLAGLPREDGFHSLPQAVQARCRHPGRHPGILIIEPCPQPPVATTQQDGAGLPLHPVGPLRIRNELHHVRKRTEALTTRINRCKAARTSRLSGSSKKCHTMTYFPSRGTPVAGVARVIGPALAIRIAAAAPIGPVWEGPTPINTTHAAYLSCGLPVRQLDRRTGGLWAQSDSRMSLSDTRLSLPLIGRGRAAKMT